MLRIALLATHGLQIILSSAVLGLSITLARGQLLGNVPNTTIYSAFLGGLGMLAGAFGVVTVFIHVFGNIIPLVIEGLITILFIAGGAVMAIGIKGGKCNDVSFTSNNNIISCGGSYIPKDGNGLPLWWGLCGLGDYKDDTGDLTLLEWWNKALKSLQQRCEEATADYGLMFAMVLLSAVALGLGYVWRRKGQGGYAY